MDESTFTDFVSAAESACERELDIEWDGEAAEVTLLSDVSLAAREAIEAIGVEMGIRVGIE